jgi:hypothetical protein
MGELTVFIFMGPAIVLGAYYVMALQFSAAALWASLPIGFLVAGILQANNLRDIDSQRAHPFVWTKPADEILKKADRQTTSNTATRCGVSPHW